MKYSCNIIQDLLPLYKDGVCDKKTSDIIEDHLSGCYLCKKLYKDMCSTDYMDQLIFDPDQEKKKQEAFIRVKKKNKRSAIIAIIAVLAVVGLAAWAYLNLVIKTTRDISKYQQVIMGPNAAEEYAYKCGMEDNLIWPAAITDEMKVDDFKMVYYNPWDAQWLGYMVVDYDDEAYAKEVERLSAVESTDYVGTYSVTGFTKYKPLAVISSEFGFIYAMTDGNNRIIYAEAIFANYFMDLYYQFYIPKDYLPDGFDATKNNPDRKAFLNQ